ncbi:hypothetical protein CYMTET_3732 [Cymbomonas tetramitiformis]|uniref:EF-hand domain-containing protein n=1 Tax=Cymbomonas tetramitiformis TaxID=36881 RepID=A0AAE0H2J7_9CHLO|nr:hypothetical protein CYMTET_3732 [Cymbomonas tetramitiformis]
MENIERIKNDALQHISGSVTYYRNNPLRFKNEILSGLTVAIAQVPESVAFSFVAGVDPIVGLYATFFLGLITAQIGGRPGMVSGAAGAMAVVIKEVMDSGGLYTESDLEDKELISSGPDKDPLADQADDQRLEYLLAVVILVGMLQAFAGVCGLSVYVKLIPVPVMTGFVNGLAVVIFLAQLQSFQVDDDEAMFNQYDADRDGQITRTEAETQFSTAYRGLSAANLAKEMNTIFSETDTNKDGVIDIEEFNADEDHRIHDGHDDLVRWLELDEGELWMMAVMISLTMAIMHFLPRLTTVVPSSLVGIIASTIFEHAINRTAIGLDTRTVKDMAPVAGGLPTFHIPDVPYTGETLAEILPVSISLCLVGLIESVLTLQLVDEILGDRSDSSGRCKQECIAQGIANFVSGIFSSMGGDAMIGQSTINVKSGGIGRLSTTFAALMFWFFILAASSVIELVPISALVGVLFMVVIYTFDWSCLPLMAGERASRLLYTADPAAPCFVVRQKFHQPKGRAPASDSFLIVLVTVVTVLTNLAYAVIAGVLVACVMFSWKFSDRLQVLPFLCPEPL